MYLIIISSKYSSICLRDITILYINCSLEAKKTIKVILNSIIRIGLIIYIEDPKEAFSVDYAYIKDIKAKETTIADIVITSHFVRCNAISVINLDAN